METQLIEPTNQSWIFKCLAVAVAAAVAVAVAVATACAANKTCI